MPRRLALAAIRLVHTAVFAVILACIGWLVWTGAAGRRDRTVGLAAGLVAAEVAVWIANDRVCPLTPLAEHLGADRGSVSDIFLPDVMARTLPIWSSALLALAAALHARSFHGGTSAREMRHSGTGLGLAIARWIVESHGGTIQLVGRETGGTMASVTLPLRST